MICFEGLRIAGGNSGASNASTISLGGVRYRGAVCWPVCANCAVEAGTMNAAGNASGLFSMSKTSCGVRQVILKRPDSIRRESVGVLKAEGSPLYFSPTRKRNEQGYGRKSTT